jgi:hypothetical protein
MTSSVQKRLLANSRKRQSTSRTSQHAVAGKPTKKGGILRALRRSPLVGANLNLDRSRDTDD